jgi:hypothetical protein
MLHILLPFAGLLGHTKSLLLSLPSPVIETRHWYVNETPRTP